MSTQQPFRVALVGTDSFKGKEIRDVLSESKFPATSVEFYDPDVEGEYSKLIQFGDAPKVIHALDPALLEGLDLVFLAADVKTSRECGELALKKKFRAIDMSGAFNDDAGVPVVVGGVNDGLLVKEGPYLVSNPHPVTIILSQIFHLLIDRFGLARAVAFVLQPVSAFDEEGIKELADQSAALLSTEKVRKKVFKEQIAFNLLSHTEPPDANGFSPCERQIVSEVRRVFGKPDFPLGVSVVQAPVFHTYSIMINLKLEKDVTIKELDDRLRSSSLFEVCPPGKGCPVTSLSVAGKDKIFVGQIKKEQDMPQKIWLWTVTDNLTFGSVLNALEIARGLFAAAQKDSASR